MPGADVGNFSHTVPYYVVQDSSMKGPVYTVPHAGAPLQPGVADLAPQQAAQAKPWRTWSLFAVIFFAIYAVLGALLWRRYRSFSGDGPPQWLWDAVLQAGDGDHGTMDRGTEGTKQREMMESIFAGTHVRGYPAGHPLHGEHWLMRLSDSRVFSKIEGQFGPVDLGKNAQLLRMTLEQQGFRHRTFFHGTQNPFVPSILTGGFLFSEGGYGTGIYVAKTYAHAQCYAFGALQSVMELEAYWKPDNESRYVKHVHHNSLLNDVYMVSDPLLIIPTVVHKCGPDIYENQCIR